MKSLFRKIYTKKRENNKTLSGRGLRRIQAFTLVEILIVVATIGILFIALVPRINYSGEKARETTVKNDFRSFELAAEQYLREKVGLSEYTDLSDFCTDAKLNMFLDKGIEFNSSGECEKDDPWKVKYTVQVIKASGSNPGNGAIIFICNGKDGKISSTDDNYTATVMYYDGEIRSATSGFSSNIDSKLYTVGISHPECYKMGDNFVAEYEN